MHVLLERLMQRPPESVSDEELLATIRLLEDGDRKYSILRLEAAGDPLGKIEGDLGDHG